MIVGRNKSLQDKLAKKKSQANKTSSAGGSKKTGDTVSTTQADAMSKMLELGQTAFEQKKAKSKAIHPAYAKMVNGAMR